MQLKINGENKMFAPEVLNLEHLLGALGYLMSESATFVVAYNQQLVNPDNYMKTAIRDGDAVDILSVITGG